MADFFDELERLNVETDDVVAGLKYFQKSRNDIVRRGDEFKRHFGLDIRRYYGNNALTMMLGFDIVKFSDDIARPIWGKGWCDVNSKHSIAEILESHFSKEAKDLIEYLIA